MGAALLVMGGALRSSAQRGQPAPATGTALLAGQVIETTSRRPVAGATVSLLPRTTSAGGFFRVPRPVGADSQGRFFFADLPAGTYAVQVVKPGYSAATIANLSRVIELGDAERITDLKIRLMRLASLSGSVRDDGGDPVVGTNVIAFRRTLVNGRATLNPMSWRRTDDRGSYRIGNLQAGEYLVCACARDPIPLDSLLLTTLASDPLQLMSLATRAVKMGADVATLDNTLRTFAPTFYPASPTAARSTRIKVGPGEEKTGVDLDVTAVHATHVSGTIIGAVSPLQALTSSILLVPAGESEEGAAGASLTPMLVQPDGRFDFAGVPPGQYVVRVSHLNSRLLGGGTPSGAALAFLGARGSNMGVIAGASAGQQSPDDTIVWAAEPIVVGETGASGLAINLRPALKVSGRVNFEGSAPPPVPQVLARSGIIVASVKPDPLGRSAALGRITADGTFLVAGLMPGRYAIASTGFPGWPTMKSVTAGGVDVTDMPIDIADADVSDIVVTFTDAPLPVLDAMLPASAASAEDLSLLVFPVDRRYWQDPTAARRRFRAGAISRKGLVNVTGLPAGEYFLVVVPDEAAAEWQEASQLETLAKTAQRVTLADGDKKRVELKR